MALWPKKKTKTERLLKFNINELKEHIQNLSSRLYPLKNEFSVHIVREVIDMARNVQILEVNKARSEKELHIHQGRLQALSDLSEYITRSLENKPVDENEPKARDAIRTRTPSHSAGLAL
jgi:predicted RNase H-like nuclease (RuvC/YqgF family)